MARSVTFFLGHFPVFFDFSLFVFLNFFSGRFTVPTSVLSYSEAFLPILRALDYSMAYNIVCD